MEAVQISELQKIGDKINALSLEDHRTSPVQIKELTLRALTIIPNDRRYERIKKLVEDNVKIFDSISHAKEKNEEESAESKELFKVLKQAQVVLLTMATQGGFPEGF